MGVSCLSLYGFVRIFTSIGTQEVLRGDIAVGLPVIGHPLKRVMPADQAVAADAPLPRYRVEL